MSDTKPKTSLWFYVPVVIVAVVIVAVVFMRNFQKGEEVGRSTPPRPESAGAGEKPTLDLRAFARDTGLSAKGKTLFMTNCASCHGPKGQGDGDRAVSLNPKPRNFQSEQFKFGDDVVSIYNTLLKGSAGTSMPSFALLPLEDVWAMVHYVRTLIPNPTATTDEIIAKLPESKPGTGKASTSAPSSALPQDTVPRIPIQLAMERMAKAAPTGGRSRSNTSLPGAEIYARHCAACHGEHGEGKALRVLSVAPYHYEETMPFSANAAGMKDRTQFAKIVTEGTPGRIMPGNAALSSQQISELFDFVRSFVGLPADGENPARALARANSPTPMEPGRSSKTKSPKP